MLLKTVAPCIEMRFSGQAWQQVYTAAPKLMTGMACKKSQHHLPDAIGGDALWVLLRKAWNDFPKNKTAHLSRVYILAASPFHCLSHTHKLSWVSTDSWMTFYLCPTSFFSCQILFVFKPLVYSIWGYLSKTAVELCTAGFRAVCGKD